MNKQTLRIIIFTGLFAIPFVPFLVSSSFFFPFITTKVFVWRIIVEIVFAAWILLALTDTEYRPKKSLVLYAVLAFLVVTGLSTVFSVDVSRSFWSNFERMEGYVSLLHLGAFFLVISSVFREVLWKRWWNTSLLASAFMVFYALFQLLGVATIHQGGARVDGTFGNASYLAVYMLIHIFIALLMMVREWKNSTLRYVYGVLILAQTFILYHTATRGAILGLLGGLLIMALLNIRNREQKVIRKASIALVAGLVIMVAGFVLLRNSAFVENSPVLSRFASISTNELKSGGRSFVWPMAMEGFKERPILGWGQENFIYVFQKHYSPEMYRLEPWFDRAHNIFLDWMVAGGILGLFSYLSLYIVLIYLIWWRDENLSHTERSILTGLMAAYFFHSFFVFDHLASYILFFALIAYLHGRNTGAALWNRSFPEINVTRVALPLVGIFLVLSLYLANIKPIMGNIFLIEALKSVQLQQFENASLNFRKAYGASILGRQEIVQHMSNNSVSIFSSNMSLEKKNEFYAFAKEAVIKDTENHSDEAKSQLAAGSFLSTTGAFDEALAKLNRARELMPNKQGIYFELGALYINMNERVKALEAFKTAYDLAPDYQEAKIIYLIGAIYAGDRAVENNILSELPSDIISRDTRIQSAYKVVGR